MGVSYRSVGALPAPFLLFDERVTRIPAGSSLVNNSSSEFKVIILLEGTFRQRVNGGAAFDYRAGDAAIFPAPCHQEIIPADPARASVLHAVRILFRNESIGFARKGRADEESLERYLVASCDRPVNIPGFMDERAKSLLRKLRAEAEGAGLARKQMICGILSEMTVLALRRLGPQQSAAVPAVRRSAEIVKRAESFMGANFARHLTLEEIAWDQKLSAEHLARVFREGAGRTVFEHLDEVRIDSAKGMLIWAGPSISEIAERCGYGSPTLFGIHFKRHTGMTPSAYRSALGFGLNQQRSRFRPARPKRF